MTSQSNSRHREGRYLRQQQFAPIGEPGQQRIREARIAVLGCGALGSVAAELLARAGVGLLRLIDRDVVEWSNLQRQSLYTEDDARCGSTKVEAAAAHLSRINSEITIEQCVVDVTQANIDSLLRDHDLIIDAVDNFQLRLLLNDWSLETQTPWVHGGCVGAEGQVFMFHGRSPCFQCLLPQVPAPGQVATCDTAGVIGPATHLIASLQVAEAIKYLSGNASSLRDRVLSVDLWNNRFFEVGISSQVSRRCPACHGGERLYLNAAGETTPAVSLCGRDAVQISPPRVTVADGETDEYRPQDFSVDVATVASRWQESLPDCRVQVNRFFARLLLPEDQTITLFNDGRAVIAGVDDPAGARTLYDRYVGS